MVTGGRVPGIDEQLRHQLVGFVHSLRELDLKKAPAISETIDWARSLLLLHARELDAQVIHSTLNVLLKFEDDINTAESALRDLLPRHADGRQHRVQQLPGSTDKRLTLQILIPARRFADNQQVCIPVAHTEHGLCSRLMQLAFCTVGDAAFQLLPDGIRVLPLNISLARRWRQQRLPYLDIHGIEVVATLLLGQNTARQTVFADRHQSMTSHIPVLRVFTRFRLHQLVERVDVGIR